MQSCAFALVTVRCCAVAGAALALFAVPARSNDATVLFTFRGADELVLTSPRAVVADNRNPQNKALLVVDSDERKLFRFDGSVRSDGTAGEVLAGNGHDCIYDDCGDGGDPHAAQLTGPTGLTVTTNGEIVIADFSARRIRVISRDGHSIRTVVRSGDGVDNSPEHRQARIRHRLAQRNNLTQIAAENLEVSEPYSVAATPDGGFIFTDVHEMRTPIIGLENFDFTNVPEDKKALLKPPAPHSFVWKYNPNGQLQLLAGGGIHRANFFETSATSVDLPGLLNVSVSANGEYLLSGTSQLFIGSLNNSNLRSLIVHPTLQGPLIGALPLNQGFVISNGRHVGLIAGAARKSPIPSLPLLTIEHGGSATAVNAQLKEKLLPLAGNPALIEHGGRRYIAIACPGQRRVGVVAVEDVFAGI